MPRGVGYTRLQGLHVLLGDQAPRRMSGGADRSSEFGYSLLLAYRDGRRDGQVSVIVGFRGGFVS